MRRRRNRANAWPIARRASTSHTQAISNSPGNRTEAKRFAVVGSGKMPCAILDSLTAHPGAEVALAIADHRHETAHSRLAETAAPSAVELVASAASRPQATPKRAMRRAIG
jgi:hypothetical protein